MLSDPALTMNSVAAAEPIEDEPAAELERCVGENTTPSSRKSTSTYFLNFQMKVIQESYAQTNRISTPKIRGAEPPPY